MNKLGNRLIVWFSLAALLLGAAGLNPAQAAASAPAAHPIPMDVPLPNAETQGSRTPIFFEDFNAGIPPAGWTITNNGGDCIWSDDSLESLPEGNLTGGTGNFADADSDNCGSGTTMNTTLTSPPINLSSAPSGTTLRFKHYFYAYAGQFGEVQIRPTATAPWTTLQTFSITDSSGTVQIDITPYIGNSDARIRFNFVSSAWGWYWQVDDVGIYEPAPELNGYISSNPVIVGYNEPVSYTLHLVNDGNLDSNNTFVQVALPNGMSYMPGTVGCSSGSCTFNSAQSRVEWTVSIPQGGTAADLTFVFRDTAAACRVIEVAAAVSDASLPGGMTLTEQTRVVPQHYEVWNFELNNGDFFGTGDWQWGAPASTYTDGPTSAHNGSNVWGTSLGGSYMGYTTHVLSRTVDLTAFNPLTGLSLTWWEWYDLTDYGTGSQDQGYVKINDNYVHAITGNSSDTWMQRAIDLTPYAGQTIELMFYLYAPYGYSPGWYIDDLIIHAACPSAYFAPDYSSINVCQASSYLLGYNLLNRTGITETFEFNVTSSPFSPVFEPLTVTIPTLENYNDGYTYFYVPENTPKGYTDIFTITATGQNSGIVAVSTVESTVGPSWEDTWADIPYNLTDGAFIGYEGQGYFISYNNTLRFDPATNQWSDLAMRPGYNYGVSDVCLGRDSDGQPTITVFPSNASLIAEIYSIWDDQWFTTTLTADYPAYGMESFDVVSDFENNRCYISGGYGSNGTFYEVKNTLYEYNPANHSVSLLATFSTPRYHHASWLMEDLSSRNICVAGGAETTALNGLNSTQCYNLDDTVMYSENSTLGTLPYPVLLAADAEKLWYGQRQLWLIGGINHLPDLNGGGQIQGSSYANTIYWDPVSHQWVSDSTLYRAGHSFEADTIDSALYTAGGSYVDDVDNSGSMTTVQRHTQCNLPLPENPSMSVKSDSSTRFSGADILHFTHDGPAVAINAPTLGLVGADDINSLSYGNDYNAEPFPLQFSVAPGATGLTETAVWQQSACAFDESAADEYGVKYPGFNVIVYDENGYPCSTEPTQRPIGFKLGEDLDALVNQPPIFVDWELDGVLDSPVYFSLAPDSPFLGGSGLTPADILVVSSTVPTPSLYISHNEIGLQPTDIIDAIALNENGIGGYQRATWEVWDGDLFVFSLAAGSPSLATYGFNPGDLLVPSKESIGTVPMLAYPAYLLGLTDSDDVDALKGIAWDLWNFAPYPAKRGPLVNPSPCNSAGVGGPESWDWLPALPLERALGFAAIAGDWLYIGNGESVYGEDSYAFAFDLTGEEWYSITPSPMPRTQTAAVCAEPNPGAGQIYVIGGVYNLYADTLPIPSDDVYAYNPQTDTWEQKSPMPTPRSNLGLAWDSVNNRIFAVGGDQISNGSEVLPTSALEIYDVVANTWFSAAPMPTTLQNIQATIYYTPTHKLYVFGGMNGITVSNVVYVYDALTNQWQNLSTAMPNPASDAIAGFCNGNIHIIGGFDGTIDLTTNRVFDPATETWMPEALPMPYPRSGMMSSAISTGNEIYIVGGLYEDYQQIDLWRYTCDAENLALIGDLIWHDLNGNGIQDSGEPDTNQPILVSLMLTDHSVFATTTINLDGQYLFEAPAGDYYLKFTPPTNFVVTLPDQGGDDTVDNDFNLQGKTPVFTVDTGEYLDWDAGLFQYASVSGMKYEDRNGNGTRDTGEPGLANWVIWLDAGIGNPISTTTTTTGTFTFVDLPPGNYTLSEDLLDGWTQTQPGDPDFYTITLASGTSVSRAFGNFTYGSIEGTKFEDMNGNGQYDNNEPFLENWVITATYTSSFWGNGVLTTTTNGSGIYVFDMLPPGVYVIEEALPDGWYQTLPGSPAGPGMYTLTLQSGNALTGKDFGNYRGGVIQGYKFNDIDGDGVWSSEPTLPNWLIYLDLNNNGHKDANEPRTLTDESGFYAFYGLPLGTYTVAEEQQPGWLQTYPEAGTHTIVLNSSGMVTTDVHFGNLQINGIGDRVWLDLDGDGIQEPGEPPVAEATVFLYDANLNLLASTSTNAQGHYNFTDLTPGDYIIGFSTPGGTVFTLPDEGGDDTLDSDADRVTGLSPVITLSSDEFNDTVDAGLFRDDLFAYQFDLFTNPPSVRQGQTPDVGLNLRRGNGVGTLTNIEIAFYRGDPENNGTLLGVGEIPTMTARSSITTTVVWLPAPSEGNYVLYAVIDPNNTIPETDETNNVISRTITVLPAFSEDTLPPIVTATFITPTTPTMDTTNVPTVTIGAAAEDNPGGSGMAYVLYAEVIYNHEVGRWVVVRRSAWLPYAYSHTNWTWTLDETPGVHFILAWAADNAGNISERPKVNFIVYYPGITRTSSNFMGYADLEGSDVHLLRLPLQTGITYTFRVTSLEGDADLYVWNPDDSAAGISENDANVNPVDEVTFTATQTAVYQVEVEGYADFSTYQIEIEVGGLPSLEDVRVPYRPRSQPITNAVAAPGSEVGVPSAPVDTGQDGNTIYLPIVFR